MFLTIYLEKVNYFFLIRARVSYEIRNLSAASSEMEDESYKVPTKFFFKVINTCCAVQQIVQKKRRKKLDFLNSDNK